MFTWEMNFIFVMHLHIANFKQKNASYQSLDEIRMELGQ